MEAQILRCWQATCPQTFYTFTELSNHHLAAHEIPLKAGWGEPWEPQARRARWEPMLRGANVLEVASTNGVKPPEVPEG